MNTLYMTKRQGKGDAAFKWLTAGCASAIALVMLGIFLNLLRHSALSIHKFGLAFLTTSSWNPVTGQFGAATSIFGTVVSSVIAMFVTAPLGIVIAVFLVELAPPMLSRIVGGAIELLAAIPSIIYGMWGLFVLAPLMANYAQPALSKSLGFLPFFRGPMMGIGMLTAGLILALMVLPFMCAVTRDVLTMVPAVLKESAHGMGATKLEVVWKVSIPYGLRGIIGAFFLALGRAIGETMAVTFVIGNDHSMSASLFAAGNTIASTLANEFAEASEPLYQSTLVELGLVLFLIATAFQIAAYFWLGRLRAGAGGAQ